MISRKETPFLLDLPEAWAQTVTELLTDSYADDLKSNNSKFQLYGKLYKGELLVIASMVSIESTSSFPTTYFVSIDLTEGQDYTKNLNSLVDSIGGFFDTFFATKDWIDYHDQWLDEEFKGQKIFFKVNRENIELTIAADQLLNQ